MAIQLAKQNNQFNILNQHFYIDNLSDLDSIETQFKCQMGDIAELPDGAQYQRHSDDFQGTLWEYWQGGGSGEGSNLPEVTIEDEGKVLGVNEYGEWDVIKQSGGEPLLKQTQEYKGVGQLIYDDGANFSQAIYENDWEYLEEDDMYLYRGVVSGPKSTRSSGFHLDNQYYYYIQITSPSGEELEYFIKPQEIYDGYLGLVVEDEENNIYLNIFDFYPDDFENDYFIFTYKPYTFIIHIEERIPKTIHPKFLSSYVFNLEIDGEDIYFSYYDPETSGYTYYALVDVLNLYTNGTPIIIFYEENICYLVKSNISGGIEYGVTYPTKINDNIVWNYIKISEERYI